MPRARKVSVPLHSQVHARLRGADFHDAYEADDALPQASAMDSWLAVVGRTPGWVDRAMDLRNAVVARIGLKDLGRLKPEQGGDRAYAVGDRVGIFSLQHLSEDEVVMTDADRHLDVWVSLLKLRAERKIVVSTVVQVHNALGRLYMLPVAPVHRLIVPAMLATS